jgi:glutaredoxin 3
VSVRIYTRKYCSYCVRAKRLLDDLGVSYDEIPVDGDPQAHARMKAESGQQTVPQIWINSVHVGGCDELMALHHAGRLAAMLGI